MKQKVQGLNREFQKTDVNRMRNLIQGKADDSTNTQLGYSKKTIDYKEGDIWTENRKKWTIKNGIKQTISKLDAIKKEIFTPLCCPECSTVMKVHLDKSCYKTHKKCMECIINFEHKLRNNNEYEDYIAKLKSKNNLTLLDEVESYLLNEVNKSNDGFVSEDGRIERWVGGVDKVKFTKEIKEAAKIRRRRLKKELDDKGGA